jgi:aminoglycoside 3-N-acetyltransferase
VNILGALKQSLSPTLKNRLKNRRNKLRFYYRAKFSPAEDKTALRRALDKLGLQRGDFVFVHSSFDQMHTIRATPVEIIDILCDTIGDSGTLVMPAFPMSGESSQDYLNRHLHFDWRRTPSRSGILTEIFRRMPDTERSMHPTHSVAARGPMASWLTEGHESSETPFDEHSPFQKLFELNAFILRLGQFGAMTFRHFADHLIQDHIPYAIYSDRSTKVRASGKNGKEHLIFTKAHNPDLTCNHEIVLTRLARKGAMKTAKVGRIPLSLVRVQTYVEAYKQDYAQGLFHHSLRPRRPL